jgi:type I restriction-modification system DNA methylase subunit
MASADIPLAPRSNSTTSGIDFGKQKARSLFLPLHKTIASIGCIISAMRTIEHQATRFGLSLWRLVYWCNMARTENVRQLANFIWSVADLLRGDYKQADYGKVILPFTVLRRLDCVLEPTKENVMSFYKQKVKPMMETKDESKKLKNPDLLLNQKAGVSFHNISQFTFQKLKNDPDNIAANLKNYINGFSAAGREILEYFNFNDYMLSNPPFGVEWKKVQTHVTAEREKKGFDGRFGAGLPRISDGSFLFLQHMIAKMKRDNGGSRIAIVFNGSPLFSGSAGSGESDIRKWIIENDMLETIIALPDQLFYNTGIYTYIWIVTNAKATARKGKIQLINGIHYYKKMSRSLGNKRNVIGDGVEVMPDQIAEITQIYGEFQQDATRRLTVNGNGTEKEVIVSKIFDNADFGY